VEIEGLECVRLAAAFERELAPASKDLQETGTSGFGDIGKEHRKTGSLVEMGVSARFEEAGASSLSKAAASRTHSKPSVRNVFQEWQETC